jgi:hypothetical protein
MGTELADMNKNASSTISLSSGVLAAADARAIFSGTTKYAKNRKDNIIFTRMRLSLWDATEILLHFAGFIAILYLAGAVALGLALLHYTFTR